MYLIHPEAFGKVAVLLGGASAEREVSLNSGRLALGALRARGVDAHPFDPAVQPVWQLKQEGVARVFNTLHGGAGENGQLAARWICWVFLIPVRVCWAARWGWINGAANSSGSKPAFQRRRLRLCSAPPMQAGDRMEWRIGSVCRSLSNRCTKVRASA